MLRRPHGWIAGAALYSPVRAAPAVVSHFRVGPKDGMHPGGTCVATGYCCLGVAAVSPGVAVQLPSGDCQVAPALVVRADTSVARGCAHSAR